MKGVGIVGLALWEERLWHPDHEGAALNAKNMEQAEPDYSFLSLKEISHLQVDHVRILFLFLCHNCSMSTSNCVLILLLCLLLLKYLSFNNVISDLDGETPKSMFLLNGKLESDL